MSWLVGLPRSMILYKCSRSRTRGSRAAACRPRWRLRLSDHWHCICGSDCWPTSPAGSRSSWGLGAPARPPCYTRPSFASCAMASTDQDLVAASRPSPAESFNAGRSCPHRHQFEQRRSRSPGLLDAGRDRLRSGLGSLAQDLPRRALALRIAATSSATAALRQGKDESGVGRWEEHHLLPYSFAEALELIGRPQPVPTGDTLRNTLRLLPAGHADIQDLSALRHLFLLIGGFPELLSRLMGPDAKLIDSVIESQRVLRDDAVDRAVYKDIPQAFNISDPMMLERLLYILAGQMTGLLSPTNISRGLGISQPTVDRYVSYLQRTFLIFVLTNYAGSESARQRRGANCTSQTAQCEMPPCTAVSRPWKTPWRSERF